MEIGRLFRLRHKAQKCLLALIALATFYSELSSTLTYYLSQSIINEVNENVLCNLPLLDPWDPKIRELLRPIPVYNKCVGHEPLTYVKGNRLFIDEAIGRRYYSNVSGCGFAPVLRSAILNESYVVGELREFASGLEMIDDVVKVACFSSKNKTRRVEYEYVHTLIHRTEKLMDKGAASKRPNVLIMLFDSMSSSSFERALPNTFRFLQNLTRFHHFSKFHTVGENTLPNLVPMLSGLKAELLLGKEDVPPPFDEFPFIWKNFSQRNYVTYLNEEWRNTMFHFSKFGFRKKPTDYWLRHYWLSLYDSKSAAPNTLNSNDHPCYYNVLFHKLGFRWLADFLREYAPNADASKTEQNLFGLFKSNEMSHDYLERLFWIDDDLKSLLQEILTDAFLENTLFILMGDHGHRFHRIRQTVAGSLEQKLPFFSLILPGKMTKQNPLVNDVLRQNRNKLTTPYDVYETLRQLLIDGFEVNPARSSYLNDKSERLSKNMSHIGHSLLMPVPHRDCEQAGIPIYLCSCLMNPKEQLSKDDSRVANIASYFLVHHINNYILKNYSEQCVSYELKSLKDFRIIDTRVNKFSIIFETSPNNAVFDGLVTVRDINSPDIDKKFQVVGKIVRVSLYGNTSSCMTSYDLKNYCYCKFNLG